MKTIIIVFLLLIPFVFFSQIPAQSGGQTQIKELKSSVLLVRLYSKAKVIEALEAKGMIKLANAVKEKQMKINKEIVAAFTNFTFCKVNFFFSDGSQNLKNGNYSQVKLFSNTENEKELKIEDSNFFVADFGIFKNENIVNSTISGSSNSRITKVKKYRGNNNNANKRCMYFRSNQLE